MAIGAVAETIKDSTPRPKTFCSLSDLKLSRIMAITYSPARPAIERLSFSIANRIGIMVIPAIGKIRFDLKFDFSVKAVKKAAKKVKMMRASVTASNGLAEFYR